MEYIVKYDIDVSDYQCIRENVGWNFLNQEQVQRALKHSMVNVSVFYQDECVGIGRIVGDSVLKGMITDVMVKKEYQGHGVGRLVITSLLKQLDSMVLEGESFQLEASPTASNRDFYIKCGLKYKPENQDGVYLWIRK